MKKFISIIVIGLSILSCSKDDPDSDAKILGTWNWEESSGGIDGKTENPMTTGENRKLEISVDSIKSYTNDVLNFQTKYTIQTNESSIFNEPREMIIQENGFRQILNFSENKLVLIGDCADCYINEYRKK